MTPEPGDVSTLTASPRILRAFFEDDLEINDPDLPTLDQVLSIIARNDAEIQQAGVHGTETQDNIDLLMDASDAEWLLELDERVHETKMQNADLLPSTVWKCCKSRCVARIAIQHIRKLKAIVSLSQHIAVLYKSIAGSRDFVQLRTRGSGSTSLSLVSSNAGPGRQGLAVSDVLGTERSTRIKRHAEACRDGFAFLVGKKEREGISVKVCVRAARDILNISLASL